MFERTGSGRWRPMAGDGLRMRSELFNMPIIQISQTSLMNYEYRVVFNIRPVKIRKITLGFGRLRTLYIYIWGTNL